ncbi:MAG: aminoacyl-tRNA deacylase [Oscillochloris sp.]|nr:aminoacyl-tRNA deacylase [Oscillochloris sp.]
MSNQKLNSMRLLDSRKVVYSVHTYVYDPDNPPDAVDVARQLDLGPEYVFKTLVLNGGDKHPILIMVPADRQLDLKRLAAAIERKRVELLARAETERLTGLKVGGIGALALVQKRWACYLEQRGAILEQIYVNAGQRGTMLGLAPADLIDLTGAQLVEAAF